MFLLRELARNNSLLESSVRRDQNVYPTIYMGTRGREVSFAELDDVNISDNGAVLLGESIVCDSHYSRPVRIITHAHSDHMLQISESLNFCEKVLATPVTKDIIGVLKGKGRVKVEDVNKVIDMFLDKVKLHVLEGEEVELYDLGTLRIEKDSVKKGSLLSKGIFISRSGGVQPVGFMNNKRMNFRYSIKMAGGDLDKKMIRFKAAPKFRKQLTNILINTDKDYIVR